MDVTEFRMEGVWFNLQVDYEGAHLYINPDDAGGGGSCMAAGVKTQEDLIRILQQAAKELDDLRYQVTFNSSENIWKALQSEKDCALQETEGGD